MKQIVLARHAEAEPGGALPDRERRLTSAGLQVAQRQARLLGRADLGVQGIVTSPAMRARQTAESLAAGLPGQPPVEMADALYNNTGDVVLRFLQRLPEDLHVVLVVGHLPWVAQLVSMLVTESRDLYIAFQPGTLACLELDVTAWAEMDPGHGALSAFYPPGLAEL